MRPSLISARFRMPSRPEDALPGVDLHEIAAEERDQRQEQQRVAEAPGAKADHIGEAEGEERRRSARSASAMQQRVGQRVAVVGEGRDVVLEGEVGPHDARPDRPEADDEEVGQRGDEERRRRPGPAGASGQRAQLAAEASAAARPARSRYARLPSIRRPAAADTRSGSRRRWRSCRRPRSAAPAAAAPSS